MVTVIEYDFPVVSPGALTVAELIRIATKLAEDAAREAGGRRPVVTASPTPTSVSVVLRFQP